MRKIVLWDVDTQVDFMDPKGKLFVPGSELAVIRENLRLLTGSGDEFDRFKYADKSSVEFIRSGSVDAHLPDDIEFKEWPEHCVYGTPGQKKIPETIRPDAMYVPSYQFKPSQIDELVEYKGQLIFEKQTTDARTNPNVKPWLEKVKPDRIAVYGVVTEICVDKAVRYLAGDLGYKVAVVIDAIKELSGDARSSCFKEWGRFGVDYVTTDDVLKERI